LKSSPAWHSALSLSPPQKYSPDYNERTETMKIKNASDLKFAIESARQEPYFFTRDSMKFFGDTMANYGIRQPVTVTTVSGDKVPAYELVRRRPVKHGLKESAFFHAETFARVFPARA